MEGVSGQGEGQQDPSANAMNSAYGGAGSSFGASYGEWWADRQRSHVDPCMPMGSDHPVAVTGNQRNRLNSYPGWDGDIGWPHPQFEADEKRRAERVQTRHQIKDLQQQNQLTGLQRQVAENRNAMAQTSPARGQGLQSPGYSLPTYNPPAYQPPAYTPPTLGGSHPFYAQERQANDNFINSIYGNSQFRNNERFR